MPISKSFNYSLFFGGIAGVITGTVYFRITRFFPQFLSSLEKVYAGHDISTTTQIALATATSMILLGCLGHYYIDAQCNTQSHQEHERLENTETSSPESIQKILENFEQLIRKTVTIARGQATDRDGRQIHPMFATRIITVLFPEEQKELARHYANRQLPKELQAAFEQLYTGMHSLIQDIMQPPSRETSDMALMLRQLFDLLAAIKTAVNTNNYAMLAQPASAQMTP